MPRIQVIGRVIIIQDGHALLAHLKGAANAHLVGGQVEHGESARSCVVREALEEFGGEVEVDRFVTVLEYSYLGRDAIHHEYNIVFTGRLLNFSYPDNPPSKEKDLELYWQPVDKLARVNLLPEPMRQVVAQAAADKPTPPWQSTMDDEESDGTDRLRM